MITGTELRAAREYAEMTQSDLSARVGKSLKTIWNWEKNGVPERDERKVRAILPFDLISIDGEGNVTVIQVKTSPAAVSLQNASDFAILDELARRLGQRRQEPLASVTRLPTEEEAFTLGAVAKRDPIEIDEDDTTP